MVTTACHQPPPRTPGRLVLALPWGGDPGGHGVVGGGSTAAPPAHEAKPRAGTGAAQADAHGLAAPPSEFPDPTGFREPRPAAPSVVPAASSSARQREGAKPHAPLPSTRKAPGLGGCHHPVPPQPSLSPRSRRPAGRAATPATSAAGASTSWSGPAPRDASSTAAASSAGSAGPRCAWATTPSTRRTVSRAWGRGAGDGVLGTGGFLLCNLSAHSSHARAPAPGHFYCLLHYPNAPGMDMPPSEPPVLPDGVSSCKSLTMKSGPKKIRGGVLVLAPRCITPGFALGCQCQPHAFGRWEPLCVP